MTEDESAATIEKSRLVRDSRWNGPPLLLADAGARVLLAGTGTHRPASRLPQAPAVAATLTDVARCLVERAHLAPDRLDVLLDPPTPGELGEALERAAREATSVLMFHFVGHALFGPGDELYLATGATIDLFEGTAGYQALPYALVRRILAGSRAELAVVVLDCCFSGGGRPVAAKAMDQPLAWPGAYVLASSSRDPNSWALPGVRHTALSGGLLRLLHEGDPEGPAAFTLDHVHHRLARSLPAAGFPRPLREAGELRELAPLAANPAHAAPRVRQRPVGAPGDPDSPYRGLVAYGPEQAGVFAGREDATRSLAARVRQALRAARPPMVLGGQAFETGGPLLVTGPSGCGKTSLLRAGLLPALKDEVGRCVVLTPGSAPTAALAGELAVLGGADPVRLRAIIESDPGAARRGLPGPTLVVVDQFEEVFTTCGDETARRRFVAALAELSASAAVVIAVRGDFFARCAAYPGLLGSMRQPEIVPLMSPAGVRRAVEEPAARAGLAVEPGLTELILEDLRGVSDDQLPRLSHALLATWRRRTGGVLTMEGYRAAGGVARAIAMSGEETLRRLGAESEPVARALLERLVRVDERAGAVPCRVPVAELSQGPESVPGQVLAELVRARLAVVERDEARLVHEALVRGWPRLASWAESRRASLLVRARLAEDAALWREDGRNPSHLYTDDRLTTAETVVGRARNERREGESVGRGVARWAAAGGPASGEVSAEEREFLVASRRRQERRKLVARGAIAVLSALVLAGAAGGVVAVVQGGRADARAAEASRLRDEALSREVAAAASGTGDTSLGAQLALAAYRLSPTPEARGALLGSLSRPIGARLIGHTAPVERVAYRPDGRVAVTASGDATARLWNVADPLRPRPLGVVQGHTGGVRAVAFTPDGKVLATGSADGTARLWDVSDTARPRPLATLKGHKELVGSVAFTPEGDVLATASPDGTTRLWSTADTEKPKALSVIRQDAGFTETVFSPDGRLAALATAGGTITILDVRTPATPATLATLTSQHDGVRGVAFSPDGTNLAAGTADGTVELWDVAAAKPAGTAKGSGAAVHDVAFSPDGALLAAASADADVRLWSVADPAAPEPAATLAGSPDAVTGVAFSPDGGRLATSSADGVARLWNVSDAARLAPRARLARHTDEVNAVAISKGGTTLATASDDATVMLWDVSDPAGVTPQSTLSGHTEPVLTAAFSPDGSRLVTASRDGTARLWDVSSPAAPTLLGTITGGIRSAAYGADERTVLTTATDGRAALWNVATPAAPVRLAYLGPADARLRAAAFRPDGKLVATGSGTSSVRLWDVSKPARPKAAATFTAHAGEVLGLRFSHDGETLATASSDGTARLWDVSAPASPRRLAELTGHDGDVAAVAFAADDRRLVTASDDRTVRVWDVADPAGPAPWSVFAGQRPVLDAVPGPDGTVLAGTSGSAVQLWGLNAEQASAWVCESAGTSITREEWARHLPGHPYTPPCP
ncbi:hypothetical protein ABZW11_22925 [Nonomuraea sp. NPDC004580]|uniref:caspase, EACC1-associated type n=1 Tax=Nonomuraea sp. NPDC004580 TaxID=3154552 RepID=UPI00339FEDAA